MTQIRDNATVACELCIQSAPFSKSYRLKSRATDVDTGDHPYHFQKHTFLNHELRMLTLILVTIGWLYTVLYIAVHVTVDMTSITCGTMVQR